MSWTSSQLTSLQGTSDTSLLMVCQLNTKNLKFTFYKKKNNVHGSFKILIVVAYVKMLDTVLHVMIISSIQHI